MKSASGLFSMLLLAGALQACTAEGWYGGTQASAEQECRSKPGDEMQRCMERLQKQRYQDYEKERTGTKPSP